MPARRVEEIWLGVLPENRITVSVFRQCKPTYVAGFGGGAWLGFSSLELGAAMDLECVPPESRPFVTDGVRVMEAVAMRIRNEKPAREDRQEPPALPIPQPRR